MYIFTHILTIIFLFNYLFLKLNQTKGITITIATLEVIYFDPNE